MTWHQVMANGIPFLVYADTLEDAVVIASVHIAYLSGARVIEAVRQIA